MGSMMGYTATPQKPRAGTSSVASPQPVAPQPVTVQQAPPAVGPATAPAPRPPAPMPAYAAPVQPVAPAPAPIPQAPLQNVAPMAKATYTPTVTTNPDLVELKNDYKNRIQTSASRENAADPRLTELYGTYRNRLSADTTGRAIGRANLAAADQASGRKIAAGESAEARGVGGSGVGVDLGGRIDEAAQRRAAGASADISLARERDLDALTLGGLGISGAQGNLDLARQGQTNALLGGAAGVVGAPAADARADRAMGLSEFQTQQSANQGNASQNLAERSFGLNQYQTQAQLDLQRQQQEQARIQAQEQAYRAALQEARLSA